MTPEYHDQRTRHANMTLSRAPAVLISYNQAHSSHLCSPSLISLKVTCLVLSCLSRHNYLRLTSPMMCSRDNHVHQHGEEPSEGLQDCFEMFSANPMKTIQPVYFTFCVDSEVPAKTPFEEQIWGEQPAERSTKPEEVHTEWDRGRKKDNLQQNNIWRVWKVMNIIIGFNTKALGQHDRNIWAVI